VTVLVVAVVVGAAGVALDALLSKVAPSAASCTVGSGQAAVDLDPEQAADAATIAAVAKRRGLANHAVTIAIATALQESKLYNVESGDRDSVGIFQQRPSQGWGPPASLIQPAYAANAFFTHLEKVHGWQTMEVALAAQAVQHSADGSAYAQWEEEGRTLARALTGEVPAGLTCRWSDKRPPRSAALLQAAAQELGSDWPAGGDAARNWTIAEWLVAHSYAFGVRAVAAEQLRWTASSGRWRRDDRATGAPTYLLTTPARS
jgi:hypothetical protein